MTQWQATADRIFVIRDEVEERTPGGIILSMGAQEKPLFGHVTSVGPVVTSIQVGDRVIFGQYAGSKVNIDGVETLILREEEVLAVARKADS